MLLYITRKNAPSIGGMQRFNQKLIAHLKEKREFRLISWGHSQALMPLFLIFTFFKTIFLRLSGKIDLIYLSDGLMSPMGLVLKKLLSVPVAVNIHGRDIAFAFPGYLTVVPAALRKMDRVICVSSQLKEICRGYGVPEEVLRVIPNGVDADDFTWTEDISPLEHLGIDPGERTILITVGRLVPKKGVDRFVEKILPPIVEKEPRVLYLVVGDGPLRETIENTVREKGLEENVRLMGDVPMDDGKLKALYCGADIFVMPNVEVPGDIEGFGIVALEGGAAGLAVVASRLQGIQEAVSPGENGILLRWDDDRAFIETILDLIRNPAKRKEIGERARQYVIDNYSWDKIAGKYSDIFSELRSGVKP
ncbi:MAG: glycosyltransferase family 4 protein [Candidatus Euphemobacter frigidus]|nr:glycosyltransferase family 4 protein [Candidatus Euphemobacter frigidus]MDP8275930.1 glycosyltransferase family 4 protein [Candidatus Euphemobacter frigidus]